jgi:hypothetical protein
MFADVTINGPLGTVTVPGICSSIRRYLGNHGIITNQYPLTFDPNNYNKRRDESCGASRNPCSGPQGDNARWKQTLGGPWLNRGAIASCDEFPFASVRFSFLLVLSIYFGVPYFCKFPAFDLVFPHPSLSPF